MSQRHPITAFALCVAVSCAGTPAARAADPAVAQTPVPGGSGVGELWEEYPLEEGRRLPEGNAGMNRGTARESPSPRPEATADEASAPSAAGDRGSGSPLTATWIVLLVALLAAVAVVALLRLHDAHRRRRLERAANPAWGQRSNVFAEGATEREGIGAFKGFVYAMDSVTGSDGDRMLWIHDPSRDKPIWVRRSEVASLTTGGRGTPAGELRRPATRIPSFGVAESAGPPGRSPRDRRRVARG